MPQVSTVPSRVLDPRGVKPRGSLSLSVSHEPRREGARYRALTRRWLTVTRTPVPVGVQIATLSSSNTGTPSERTRVAAVAHPAFTHGPPADTGKEQPEME
jgi:hypothetical protein